MRLRPREEHRVLHALSNLSRQRGLRQRVIEATDKHSIRLARTGIHTCGWLAQVDENRGIGVTLLLRFNTTKKTK